MKQRSQARPLRRTIGRTAVATAAIVVVGVTVVYAVTDRMLERLSSATERFVEEQRIAERIGQAVVRQLVAASAGASRGDPEARRAFDEAGARVYGLIQDYLFRPLSTEERLQLEAIKRQHQHLEVAAVQAADLEARGDTVAADEARARMFEHASSLLGAVEDFVILREQGLERLRVRQDEVFRTFFVGTGLLALALLGASLLAGRFLHRRVSGPLARLAEATGRIGAGDLDARIRPAHDDEIGQVAEGFNRMAESLAAARARLRARNAELASALEKVRSTQEELVQAEKMSALGRMTAGLAHELNNPLASVLAFAELLKRELEDDPPPGPEELRRDFVEPLVQEATRTRTLVQNLLVFSRRSGGTAGRTPVREALDVAVGLERHAFEQRGLAIETGPVPDVLVSADRERLQDAFVNVIGNAVDAMGDAGVEDGALRIHGTLEGERLVIRFDDDGPGFAEPDRVFEPFYTTKPVGRGTGLGLALVHRFLTESGGGVTAEEAPGGGGRVVVGLRVCAAAGETPDDLRDTDADLSDAAGDRRNAGDDLRNAGGDRRDAGGDRRDTDEEVARRPEPAFAEGAPGVLVVEDEPQLRRVQERLLRRLGVRPILASSVQEARDALEREEIALVISDVRMPDESGIDLYRWLEEHRPRLFERFLFITGDVYGPDTRALADARPDLFIQKPFEMEEYLERVSAALASGTRD